MTKLGSEEKSLRFTGERLNLQPRTDDPTDLRDGTAWIRGDLDDDQLATFRYYDGAETVDLPILPAEEDVDEEGGVSKAVRVVVEGEEGFIPISPREDATSPEWSIQHDGHMFGFTDNFAATPDSVVSRPDDDGTINDENEFVGLKIKLNSNWPSIGARVSNNTIGATRAYLWDNNQNTIQSVDISELSSGDVFAFNDVDLQSGDEHYIVLDAEGAEYDLGWASVGEVFPIEGDDLDIIARWYDEDRDTDPMAVDDIGNPDGVLN